MKAVSEREPKAALMYSHFEMAGLPGPELIAMLTSEEVMQPLSADFDNDADIALLALYQNKFRDNVEFYGRILMAHPGVTHGEASA